MPKRWHPRERQRIVKDIIKRDGAWCVLCVLEGQPLKPIPKNQLTVDHLNSNNKDDRLANLILLCGKHNSAEGGRFGLRAPRILTPENILAKRAEALRLASVQGESPVAAVLPTSGAQNGPSVAKDAALAAAGPKAAPIYIGRPDTKEAVPSAPPSVTTECERERERERDRAGSAAAEGESVPVGRIGFVSSDRPDLDSAAQDAAVLEAMIQPLFHLWVFVTLQRRSRIGRKACIAAGSNFLQDHLGRGATITLGRYMDVISNEINGWLVEARDDRGKLVYSLHPTLNRIGKYTTLYGRVLALNALLVGAPIDLSGVTLDESEFTTK